MWWLVWCVFVAACLRDSAAVVGGAPAAPPEPDAAVVFLQKHGRNSRLEGIRDNRLGYYSFTGIRYAEPPVGPRRFRRPVRRLMFGDVSATTHCQPCPQPHPTLARKVIGHEDCLCLNIYAPKMPGDENGCPVVFFIHGGNYRHGSSAYYGGQHLAQKDTILVTAQYRLGSLGFLSSADRDASGNVGLFDLRAAMTWITDYIEYFGGDPTRVVVMGQGSGGAAASLLALSGEGRAQGAVALSGAPLAPAAVRSGAAGHAARLATLTGCPRAPPERLLLCLRKLPQQKIVEADMEIHNLDLVDTTAFLDELSGRSGVGARVEGAEDQRGLPLLVMESPAESLQSKKPHCALLTGVTSAETSRSIFGKFSKFLSKRLQEAKNFIKDEIVGGLQEVLKEVQGLFPKPLKENSLGLQLSDYYQSLFENSLQVDDGLSQIVEATGDALFNFPAYKSVEQWSAGGPAFLYSFEHVGNLTKGSHFLPGVTLAAGSEDPNRSPHVTKGPSHGDELAYIFEPLDEAGKSVLKEISSVDAKLRDSFVSFIADFAHSAGQQAKNTSNLFSFLPFSLDKEKFIKIHSNGIELDKNFRFCQLALWGNMGSRLGDTVCKNFLSNLQKLPGRLVPMKPNQNLPILQNLPRPKPPTQNQKSLPFFPLDLPL